MTLMLHEPFYGFKESNNHMLDNLNLAMVLKKFASRLVTLGKSMVIIRIKDCLQFHRPPQSVIQSTAGSASQAVITKETQMEYDPYAAYDMNSNPSAAMSNFDTKDQYSAEITALANLMMIICGRCHGMNLKTTLSLNMKYHSMNKYIRRREEERKKHERIKFKRPL